MIRTAVLAAAALLLAPAAVAKEVRAGDLSLSRLQLRASIGNTPTTAGYLVIANPGARPDRLIGAACACAQRVELHATSTAGGVARMTAVSAFAVPARGRLSLEPGGSAHLMLSNLRRPLREGERVPVTLRFERAGAVTAVFQVTARPGAADPHAHH